MRRLPLLLALLALLPAAAAWAQSPPPPGLAATRPFVGVWAVAGEDRRFDVHHAGPFLLWVTPSDGSWVGSSYALAAPRGPAAVGRFVRSGDGTVRLTLPDREGVAPVRDAVLRRVADRPSPDVSLAATFCDPDALGLPRTGVRRLDETGGGRGIGPRADLRDAILTGLDLRGADLTGADLRGAVLCGVDLSRAKLAGARLDGAILAPAYDGAPASLAEADLTGASLVDARLGGMDMVDATFDRADLRGATIGCTPGMVAEGCAFSDLSGASIVGADLRGAHAPAWGRGMKDATGARLDGAGFTADRGTVDWLAGDLLAAGEAVVLHPALPFRRGEPQRFTGAELRTLRPLLPPVPAGPPPGFDCTAARLATERAICERPELAARDRAVATLWQARSRTEAERTAQRAWLARRNGCGVQEPCLGDVYAERLRQLATDLPLDLPKGTTLAFSAEPGFKRPPGDAGALLGRYLAAHGEPEDDLELAVDGEGNVLLSGASVGTNGHSCSIEGEALTVKGRLLTAEVEAITDEEDPLQGQRALSLVLAGDILVVTTAGRDFCGMRASWSDVYFKRR